MILWADLFDDAEAAVKEATEKANAPADPSHDGWVFTGWAVNVDEFGDYILVAKYNQVEPEPEKTKKIITYIDPLSGKPVLLSVEDDGTEIVPPEPNKYDDMQFLGWVEVVDPNGNKVYVAKYAADCRNAEPAPPAPSNNPEPPGNKAPNTGDPYRPYEWMTLGLGSGALVVALLKRKARRAS